MSTRMLQRRGTAAQWISTNSGNGPILAAGEIGFESDTNKFKIGDGINHWINLDYFVDSSSTVNPAFGSSITFEGETSNAFETTLAVTDPTADRTLTLPDSTGTIATQEYVDGAVTGVTGSYSDLAGNALEWDAVAEAINVDFSVAASRSFVDGEISTHASDSTSVHGIADTSLLVTTTGTQTLTNKTLTSPKINEDVALTATATELNLLDGVTATTTELNYVDGVTSAIQTQMDAKAPLDSPTFTGTVTLPANTISQSMMGDDSVGTNEIGGLAVTTEKIAALAVTEGKIADSAVTSAKIADGTIVNADINTSAAIAQSKVADLTTDLAAKLALAGGTMTGALTLSADPSASLHAATKQYVDNTASGVVAKPQVLGATTANIDATYSNGTAGVGATLTHNTNGALPSESGGASGWAVGKGILVKNQTNKEENGRYYVSDMGSPSTPYILTRCGYCDEANEIPGAYIFVQDGTFAGTGWIQVVADPATFTVGTDDIDVFQFSGSGTITAGTGITVSGNEVSISTGAITSSLILDGTIVDGDISASAAIAQSKISGLSTSLSEKAPLASPTFTGTVTIPDGAALGTPASGTLTNATGLPVSGIVSSTSAALGLGSIELGHATDTTIARASAGLISVEGVVVPTVSSENALSNKSLSTTTTFFIDPVDPTKKLKIITENAATSVTGTLATSFTTSKTLTLPDATDTLVGRATTDTLTNKTLTSPVVSGGTMTSTVFVGSMERTSVSATAATGTINFDAKSQSVLYYTTNSSGNWTLNIRGDGSTTLNTLLAINDAMTIVFMATNGTTAYRPTALQIDGSSVTPKYQGGTAWASGNASSIDAYTYTVVKTGNGTFTVLASQTKFA
jgi:hypothetical protein